MFSEIIRIKATMNQKYINSVYFLKFCIKKFKLYIINYIFIYFIFMVGGDPSEISKKDHYIDWNK